MDTLHSLNSSTNRCDEPRDLNLSDQLVPLIQKLKLRLSESLGPNGQQQKQRLRDYSRQKLERAHAMVEALDRRLQRCCFGLSESLEHCLAELSQRYHEFEAILAQDPSFDEKQDNDDDPLIDRIVEMIEEIDDSIEETIDRVHRAGQHFTDGARRLFNYEELPIPWRNNKYIHTGYRFLPTPADCWHSLLYLHNETGNIYTHLIGFIFFFGIGIYELFYSSLLSDAPTIDRMIFAVFFLAACKCLMCSAVWHTLSGISDYALFKRMACLDYVGISVLICASVVLTEYYGFYCDPIWRNTYTIGTSTLAVVGAMMPFTAWFDQREMRWLRISFFVVLAASGAIPLIHLYINHGTALVVWISPVVKSLACYILGVVVYAKHYPEALWPGKFDHIGHSHQLWHLFVCAGIWYHYTAAVSFVGQRQEIGMCRLQ